MKKLILIEFFIFFSGEGATPYLNGYFGQANSSVPVLYTSISCSSTDTRIEDCYLSSTGTGFHSLDVGVKCQSGSTILKWSNFASPISLVVTIKLKNL
jgi:hypothetical protein